MSELPDHTEASRVSRRSLIAGLAGSAAAAALPIPAEAATPPSLAQLAREKGILFGTATRAEFIRPETNAPGNFGGPPPAEAKPQGTGPAGAVQVPQAGGAAPGTPGGAPSGGPRPTAFRPDPRYLDLIRSECSVIVAENEMKPFVLVGSEEAYQSGSYNFEPGDVLLSFARKNRIKMRGHTLMWNHPQYMPRWITEHDFGPNAREGTERMLRDYIKRVCTHFGKGVVSWDVINESIDPKDGQLRPTPFNKAWGNDALRIAFEAARENAPWAQLVYNDYMSWEADHKTHRSAVLKLLEYFRKSNVPVDALGIQSHIIAYHPLGSSERKDWVAFINEVVAMDYGLLLTEFDVNELGLQGDRKAKDLQVSDIARSYLDLMLSYPQLDQVLCWGLLHKYSWLQNSMFLGYNKGLPLRPTPFDDEYRPIALRDGIAAAFTAATKRTPSRYLR